MIEGPQAGGGGESRETSREEQKGEEHDMGIEGDRTRKRYEEGRKKGGNIQGLPPRSLCFSLSLYP